MLTLNSAQKRDHVILNLSFPLHTNKQKSPALAGLLHYMHLAMENAN